METKSITEILNIKFKFYKNVLVTDGIVMTLSDIIQKPHELNAIKAFRKRVIGMSYSEKQQLKDDMRPDLPCFTPTGLFGANKSISSLVAYSNIISVDIDPTNDKGDGNSKETMEKVPEILRCNPYVFYYNKSLSNSGYYALILVDGTIEDYYPHYQALLEDFKVLGVELDKNAVKITQPRFLTLPEEGFMKDSCEVYTKKSVLEVKRSETTTNIKRDNVNNAIIDVNSLSKLEKIICIVENEKLNIVVDHKANFEIRCVIKNIAGSGDEGFKLYRRVMNFRPDYADNAVIEKWNADERYGNFSIGTAYYHLAEARRKKVFQTLNRKLLRK
ncbi:MAG: hypothetical protein JZU53_04870 [Paludibacter sp.]|nr:hypothetical protein [Paludibacter sp.]